MRILSERKGGFTLIELLIVVAIIAILALIAVPNFLEAQTRAKVSRVKTDHRSIGVALEAYRVDWNSVPIWDSWAQEQSPLHPGRMWWALTTPVAYMTSALLDPFIPSGMRSLGRRQVGLVLRTHYETATGYLGQSSGNPPHEYWCASTYGPDVADDTVTLGLYPYTGTANPYDPTNGTISWGDIYRHGGRVPSNFVDEASHSNVTNSQGAGDPWSWVR